MSTPSNTDTLPPGAHIGRTALRVNDLDKLTEFYRTVVGLSVRDESDTRSVLGTADTELLVLEGDADAPTRHSSDTGLFHTAFRVPSRAALGDALVRIRDQWQLGGASDHWVSEALYLSDPEGNGIEIYHDYPREEWPLADDGTVRMSTEQLDLASVEATATGSRQIPSGTDIGHVHLEVSSLDAFRDFYVDTLGFEMQTTESSASFVSAGGYHHHVGANTWNHRTRSANGRGLSWFEVVVRDREALDAVRERLGARDVPFTETDDGIVVHDADEIEVHVRSAPSNR